MKKIFLKYNPYKLETEITVDGKHLADNSKLGELIVDSRLQDWVEDFPAILIDEYNDRDFEVVFHGTLLDYEDLTSVFTDAYNKGLLTAKLDRIPAKETADKERLIEDVLQEIIGDSCPFQQLRDPQIKAAFDLAMSDDFEVCVVATMSAGKSTLINAMLGSKLMPSKQEACTAIITRIKDEDCGDFYAEVYDKSEQLIEIHEHLTYATMERLNGDEQVSEIRVFGKIPFVSMDGTTQKREISLILIDTPGPNNSRNPDHGKKQRELLGKSSKALVLYVMTGEFGTDDDNTLLARVADSMTVRGKQSKDRFIFVVNKLDGRKKEDGNTEQTLERVRSYLKSHGISNPNLFPAAALPALNIRLMNDPAFDMDEDDRDETEIKIKKLNRNEELHFETWAALPLSVRGEINGRLTETRRTWSGRDNENPEEALIHSGIVSVEAAIRQYVQKYAKTAKIKNIVDTFIHRVKELGCEEQAVLAIAESDKERERIAEQIQRIQAKMDSADEAKRFKNAVDDAVVRITDESKEVVENIVAKFQAQITKRIDSVRDTELTIDEAKDEVERLTRFVKKLEPDFEEDLRELLTENLIKTGNALIEEYKKKIAALKDELGSGNMEGFTLNPLKLISGSIPLNFLVQDFVKKKEVEDGQEWIDNKSKKWYKFWTWFQESGHWQPKYKEVEYVLADELAQSFFKLIQEDLYKYQERAQKYAIKHSKEIAMRFNQEFDKLDAVLKNKLTDLESLATDRIRAKKRAEEARQNKAWLDAIQDKVESILEI